ncbi:DUF429 domain-containing protein [Pseudonocardia sp. KRD291]|uniref:DUF429 domain-containing protein n=1 Tax=Pseudonocardia sp. KRD291 TaxID=2792007 RepID=UPI001C49E983|nr:DUF429 domain-containing protein [Pseudonocardia sp. KRD291]MBW0105584.1 DUF429 domain-containing protein [Pseudonocardia sp. KRD291]
MQVAGVDGVPDGWVVCVLSGAGSPGTTVSWSVEPDAAAVLARTRDCGAVGVDIPIGLPSGPARRACDVATAARLGRARSSVFPAPPREVLAATSHPDACAMAREVTGKAISLQTFQIGAKIREWDALDAVPATVVEAHPELSLRTLAPDVAFVPKKTARGLGQRIAALARWVDPALALADLPARTRLDDVLDALAVSWTAARWLRGEAETLGDETDARGRPMRVVV